MEIISKQNEVYISFKEKMKNPNSYPNYTITDDLQVLRIAYDMNLEIDTLLYDYETEYKEETKALLDNLINVSNEAYMISSKTYKGLALKENHAGIIASIKFKDYILDDFRKMNYVLVLDSLEIPGNIGTIYRTCDSVKIDGIILVDPVSKLNNPKLTASARGCNLIIPTISLTYEEAQGFLLDSGFDIFLGEPELGLDYQQYDYKGKIAIVVGNERFGINKNWYSNEHKRVFIPMEGNQNSLNVGVAASILLYEAYMKRR